MSYSIVLTHTHAMAHTYTYTRNTIDLALAKRCRELLFTHYIYLAEVPVIVVYIMIIFFIIDSIIIIIIVITFNRPPFQHYSISITNQNIKVKVVHSLIKFVKLASWRQTNVSIQTTKRTQTQFICV